MYSSTEEPSGEQESSPVSGKDNQLTTNAPPQQEGPGSGRRHRVSGAVIVAATQLLPLVKLLDAIQPQVASESVFHTRRKKIQASFAVAYQELKAERPKRNALTHAFQTMSDLVREESHDISQDELKQAAKEVVLATLKNAPALISAAHQARLLS
ncbi:hypothetical protein [Hymenobacter cavernae]|uniref:Uncharacterized protein n=1 Tax=Hymenobacter cavernae TaxID=2044852 RepID=A0ABQ1TZZ3_9BACT|nr:hypothetical protein [Hymenobacter cavernae]GGF07408.1 hypothetical protein GCM10011383_18080 [Hymenobacter cavernae]